MAASMVTPEHIQQFHDEGYFILERVIPEEQVQMLRDNCQFFIDRRNAEMDKLGTDVMGIIHRDNRYFINKCYQNRPEMGAFLFGDLMEEICRATLGDNAYFFIEQYVVKFGEKANKFSWHQDSAYQRVEHKPFVTTWSALDDVSEENGTIHVLPYSKSGTRTRMPHVKDPESNDLVGYTGNEPGIPVIVPAGSMAVFSSVVFHYSGPNMTKNQRRTFLTAYSSEPILDSEGAPIDLAIPFIENGKRVRDC